MPSVNNIFAWLFQNVSPFQLITALVATSAWIYVAYKLHWEGPRVEIHSGDRIFLVAPVGASAPINMILSITNRGSRTGVLQFLETCITMPNGRNERFEWAEFYRYEKGNVVVKEFDPHPIPINAKASASLRVQFILSTPAADFQWLPGQYSVALRGWVARESRTRSPNVESSFGFSLPEHDAGLINIVPEGRPFTYYPVRVAAWALHTQPGR